MGCQHAAVTKVCIGTAKPRVGPLVTPSTGASCRLQTTKGLDTWARGFLGIRLAFTVISSAQGQSSRILKTVEKSSPKWKCNFREWYMWQLNVAATGGWDEAVMSSLFCSGIMETSQAYKVKTIRHEPCPFHTRGTVNDKTVRLAGRAQLQQQVTEALNASFLVLKWSEPLFPLKNNVRMTMFSIFVFIAV